MVTLVTDQAYKFGQENIIPYAGKVKISSIGTIEVEDDLAQQIVDCNCGFSFHDGAEATTTTSTEAPTTTTTTVEQTTTSTTIEQIGGPEQEDLSKVEKDDLGGSEQDDLSKSETTTTTHEVIEETTTTTTIEEEEFDIDKAKAELDQNNLTQLKEMVKDFPAAEWRTLNKEKLIDYIITKIVNP